MRKSISTLLLAAILMVSIGVTGYAVDYDFETSDDTEYYDSTSYEDIYGSQYNYGGPNIVDYQVPELEYGNPSSTQTGVMERALQPDLQESVLDGGAGGYGIAADGPFISIAMETEGTSFPVISYSNSEAKHTSVENMENSDGSIGTVSIPSLDISMKVWEGETNASMSKGMGHYSSTSGWDGNVGVCGHNRGAKYVIGSIKDLDEGDTISYTTVYGTRTYQVTFVGTISNNDWSYLEATTDNRITITTCLADHPDVRVCVQAVEVI